MTDELLPLALSGKLLYLAPMVELTKTLWMTPTLTTHLFSLGRELFHFAGKELVEFRTNGGPQLLSLIIWRHDARIARVSSRVIILRGMD